ncbi:hypothetical protein [Derxia lacustris]|uniref:hypothetical protein n=1 Tax=Derxia lacustris TaxID=764842 RepID=UPI000A176CBF|nr:hypothetical protein [Derxia lacustris]
MTPRARLALALRRGLGRLLLLAAVACALAALAQLGLAARAAGYNQRLAAGRADPGDPAMLHFGKAIALARHGDAEAALASYADAEVAATADPALQLAVRMNVANLYLREALANASDPDAAPRAITLIELAKASYRRVLHDRPDAWDARYNLELAQMLMPDYQQREWRQSGNETGVDEKPAARSAWTDMVGTPRGMH